MCSRMPVRAPVRRCPRVQHGYSQIDDYAAIGVAVHPARRDTSVVKFPPAGCTARTVRRLLASPIGDLSEVTDGVEHGKEHRACYC
jgi:hypothetical protein